MNKAYKNFDNFLKIRYSALNMAVIGVDLPVYEKY